MITTKTSMTLEHFHDFYFLQAVHAAVGCEIAKNPDIQFKRSVEKLQDDLQKAMDDIIPNIALRTFVYLYAACMGEARHARESAAKTRFIPETLHMHRAGIYKQVTDYRPTKKNLFVLSHIYDQEWTSGFGGKAWKNIADALPMYFNSTPAAFIDHVIDLEHNGGTAFNKDDARLTLFFKTDYPGRLKHFLDYKFEKDILTEEPSYKYHPTLSVTRKVYNIVSRYTTIFGKKEVTWIEPKLDKLTDYVVEWSDGELVEVDKWWEWIDCSNGNKPNAKQILNISQITDIDVPAMTFKEIKKRTRELKERTLNILGNRITGNMKKAFIKEVNNWLKYAEKECMPDPKSKTYAMLPCKVQPIEGYKVLVEVPVKYEGHGRKTKNGFMFNLVNVVPAGDVQATEKGYNGEGLWQDGHLEKNSGYVMLFLGNTHYYILDKQLASFLD